MNVRYKLGWIGLVLCGMFLFPNMGTSQEAVNQGKPSPKVGLVLSGGGARGFAHIGVLKVLEEVGIPVDYIVGTSMGSIVAGLYAIGYSAADIERVVTEVDWEDVFSDTPPRNLWSYQKKKASAKYILGVEFTRKGFIVPRGLTAGQKISNLLAFLTIRASDIENFDQFPIPYRAVAADIVTGEEVVIDHGALADAMRSSMAVPGVFTPMTLQNHLLVDGGVVKNLPVDVVQKMGADIIIAVDVSSPLKGSEELGNPLSILNQMISLQIVKSTEEQRKLADLVVITELGELSSTDFGRGPEIIAAGERSARAQLEEFRSLASRINAERGSGRSVVTKTVAQEVENIHIGKILVEGDTSGQEEMLAKQLEEQKGKPLNPKLLERKIEEIFSTGNYETVKFTLAPGEADNKTLKLLLQGRNKGAHTLRFGMNYEAHFNDAEEDQMIFLVNAVLNDLTNGGTWSSELQFVNTFQFESEYVQPLGRGFYCAPKGFMLEDFRSIYEDKETVARYETDEDGFELRFGTFIRRFGELSWGYRFARVNAEPTSKALSETLDEDFPVFTDKVIELFVRTRLDTLDTFPFPSSGRLFTMDYQVAGEKLASDVEFHRFLLDYWRYWALGQRNTVGLRVMAGTDFKTGMRQYQYFTLGGRDSFVGFKKDELAGVHLGMLALEYRRKVHELPSAVGGGIFAVATANVGNVWKTFDQLSDHFSVHYGGSVGVGIDTLLGPVRADFAMGDGGRQAVYLNIGYTF